MPGCPGAPCGTLPGCSSLSEEAIDAPARPGGCLSAMYVGPCLRPADRSSSNVTATVLPRGVLARRLVGRDGRDRLLEIQMNAGAEPLEPAGEEELPVGRRAVEIFEQEHHLALAALHVAELDAAQHRDLVRHWDGRAPFAFSARAPWRRRSVRSRLSSSHSRKTPRCTVP